MAEWREGALLDTAAWVLLYSPVDEQICGERGAG